MHHLQLSQFIESSEHFSLKLDGASTLSKTKVYGIGMVNEKNIFMALGSFEELSSDAEAISKLVFLVLQRQCRDKFSDVLEKIISIGSDQARTQLRCNVLLIQRFKTVSHNFFNS